MKTTDKVLLVTVGALLAYEAWTLCNKEPNDTISESVWDVTKHRPIVPFAAGMLAGHFFFSKRCQEDG